MHGRVGKDRTAHFRQLNKQYTGRVFLIPRVFAAQESLQPVEQRYTKAQWYASVIIDLTHEVWSHASLGESGVQPDVGRDARVVLPHYGTLSSIFQIADSSDASF